MSDILTTRDGLIGNSPRYVGAISPPYMRFLKDDSGAVINLTGVPTSNLSIVFVNRFDPTIVNAGSGTWSILNAAQGEVSYQYGVADLLTVGDWYLFVTVQLLGEPAPRVFDPDLLSIKLMPSGGEPVVTIQNINISEVNGATPSPSNPLPTSIADGADVAQGTTTDSSSANTTIGLLKAIKAYLGGTLNVNASFSAASIAINDPTTTTQKMAVDASGNASVKLGAALPAGTNVIGHVIVDSAGNVSITSLPSLPAGTNVIGHVIVDSAGSVSVTSLPSLPAGTNTIGGVKLIDSAGTNVGGIDASGNVQVKVNAALPAGTNVIGHVIVDSAGSVSVTSLPSLPAGTNVIGHVVVDSGSVTLGAGSALIGTVEIADSAGTNKLAVDSSGNASVNIGKIGGQAAAMAGSDAQTAANVPLEAGGLYNGSTIDRWRSTAAGDGLTAGVAATGLYGYNGASEDRIKTTAAGDGQVNGVLGAGVYVYNGSSEDRLKGDNTGAARVSLYGKNSVAGDTAVTVDSSGRPTAIIQVVGGTAIAVGNNALPILNSAATGYVAAYGSNPAALTANTDAAFKWGASGTTQVNHVMIQNGTTINVLFDLDTATNAGSPVLAPGQTLFFDVQTTAVHLQTNGTPNLNGSSSGNIIVRGWL